MKLLNGLELVGYIKERQAKQVRNLRQQHKIFPKLAIIQTGDNAVTDTYVRLKQAYGEDILIQVDVCKPNDEELFNQIQSLNNNPSVHGVIIQLPLNDPELTDQAINLVSSDKDVDGLCDGSPFVSATAVAVDWLLAGYNIDLRDKRIAVVGKGRLVGAPLIKLWRSAGLNVTVCDSKTPDLGAVLRNSEVIVSAVGKPGLITSDMISAGSVVVDAGTASEKGEIVGDLAAGVRQRDDLVITPTKGGVGPLTVAALFDNVITAARRINNL